ncbi:MAG: hypothetical protein ABSD20_13005 [Terriglobales bacterium]|jgi:hypothetical protein
MPDCLRGSSFALILYDVSEEIDLESLRSILGARRAGPALKHAAPEYVRFQRPPVIETLSPLVFDSGEKFAAQLKYYDYGVISVIFDLGFEGGWHDLIQRASCWMVSGEFERRAGQLIRQNLERARPALVKSYKDWLVEDYFIFHLNAIPEQPTANALLKACGDQIACVVRGEKERLSEGERSEVLQSSISYYPNDVAVVGWHAAFLYDNAAGAQGSLDLVEYANTQLLEFRHYDDLLTRELGSVYRTLDRSRGAIRRWRLARQATRLQTVTLEVTELTERVDNAIKFLSDMFSARLYRMAAAKIGVPDYKTLVNQKLHTADELYRFMIEQFQQGRAFVLELMVVVILVIELVFLFRGK